MNRHGQRGSEGDTSVVLDAFDNSSTTSSTNLNGEFQAARKRVPLKAAAYQWRAAGDRETTVDED